MAGEGNMANSQVKIGAKIAATEGKQPSPIVAIATARGPMHFVVVGAGGTGARVVPPLTQMMRPGDVLSILDHDVVEDRNLVRQHFSERDIGSPKALVLATRYRKAGMEVNAYQRQVVEGEVQEVGALLSTVQPAHCGGTIIIGCVDNAAARRGIAGLLGCVSSSRAWIDVGNEMRAGQVLLSLNRWLLRVPGVYQEPQRCSMNGLALAMPQLLRDEVVPTAGCGVRMDLQTVQVNHMAAGAAINVVSWLLMGIPFTSCGSFFSTLNTMQPIRIERVSGGILFPETTYAVPAVDEAEADDEA